MYSKHKRIHPAIPIKFGGDCISTPVITSFYSLTPVITPDDPVDLSDSNIHPDTNSF